MSVSEKLNDDLIIYSTELTANTFNMAANFGGSSNFGGSFGSGYVDDHHTPPGLSIEDGFLSADDITEDSIALVMTGENQCKKIKVGSLVDAMKKINVMRNTRR